jgi:hypothetical protein
LNQPELQLGAEINPESADDSHLSMAERRPWARRLHRCLPLRFRDIVPQPSPPLPLASPDDVNASKSNPAAHTPETSDTIGCGSGSSLPASTGSRLRRIFKTPLNVFGLSRQYESTELPSHDPEEHVSLQDLSNIPVCADQTEVDDTYFPFPNRSSFLLSEWHWNGGEQKSRSSFRNLMDIIGNPDFQTADIRDINWDRIDGELGAEDDGAEWLDEDAGWTHTPVTISVPYQSRRGVPSQADAGPRNYTVDNFCYRSLASVIKEKISGLKAGHQFHLEPHELHWQQGNGGDPIRVQGELYTSPAFLDAHRELQDSPGEPACNLQRVVIALMFWSDATQLTSFGNAKLWPLYMFFGNESKYHRCKPTCHLCEHIAYFQKVPYSYAMSLYALCAESNHHSCQIVSKTLLVLKPLEAKLPAHHSWPTATANSSMSNGRSF